MADENGGDKQAGRAGHNSLSGNSEKPSGNPGRTPGKAEGDEETVEESLRQKES